MTKISLLSLQTKRKEKWVYVKQTSLTTRFCFCVTQTGSEILSNSEKVKQKIMYFQDLEARGIYSKRSFSKQDI